MDYYSQIQEAAAFIRQRASIESVDTGIILGSGLGPMADAVENAVSIPYREIPHFPVSTVHGHAGEVIIGKLGTRSVAVLKGRVHFYEGYPMLQVTFPTRILRALGAETLVVTNASGGLAPELAVGDILLISDHIHLMPNPLVGPNDARLGTRFPQMAHIYDLGYREQVRAAAARLGIKIHEGVYLGLTGPSFETPAEIRYFTTIGADTLGMSTTPEVIVASHGGMRVLGISCVTNVLHSGPCNDTHQDVLDAANRTGPHIMRLLTEVLSQPRLPSSEGVA